MTSRKPNSTSRYATETHCDSDYGYETNISYVVLDQLNATVPSVPLNEYWSTAVAPDYTGANWRRKDPNGFTSGSDAAFGDHMQGEAATRFPTATCDGNSTKVQHWGQQFYIGSTTPGAGALVETHTLQKYIGYSDHQ
jgi:hypothetical protein